MAREITVIVPTRNRSEDLADMLKSVSNQSLPPTRIIIVDSSDKLNYDIHRNPSDFTYIYTHTKSAAQQRNYGLDWMWEKNCQREGYVAFLDDDVLVPYNYFEDLVHELDTDSSLAGVSGIAGTQTNYKNQSKLSDFIGATGLEGTVTKACVNIPVRPNQGVLKGVQWLIGCSMWRYEDISNLYFERDFQGSSIFEDVIFSYKVSRIRKKRLAVNSNLIFEHKLSRQSRASTKQNYIDWTRNRRRFIELNPEEYSSSQFYLYNIAATLYYAFTGLFLKRERMQAALGIILGSIRIH